MNTFMERAIQEAHDGVRSGDGGPFGAVIVKDGKIVAAAHNMVLSTHDPTAHAEVTAIREASRALGRFDLSDCEIYTTCEPCPMCLAAIHWARIPHIYQGVDRRDAASIGFDDEYLYDAICGKDVEERITVETLDRDACFEPMKQWTDKDDKTPY